MPLSLCCNSMAALEKQDSGSLEFSDMDVISTSFVPALLLIGNGEDLVALKKKAYKYSTVFLKSIEASYTSIFDYYYPCYLYSDNPKTLVE